MKLEMVNVGGASVGRATFQPSWRWSESIKPIVGTDACRVHHLGMLLEGKLHVVHQDGTESDLVRHHNGQDIWEGAVI